MRPGSIGWLPRLWIVLACLLCGVPALAQAPPRANFGEGADRESVFMNADRYTLGAPARADLGDVAKLRLLDMLYYLPDYDASKRVLGILGIPTPQHLLGSIRAPISSGANLWGTVEFVPSGPIDADDVQPWSAADLMASVEHTVEEQNKQYPLLPREMRGWVEPPTYDAQAHRITWAPLILSKEAPKNSSGDVAFNGVAFGRDGFIRVTIFANTEQAAPAMAMMRIFFAGLTFNPGKGYDPLAAKSHDSKGLADAFRLNDLRRAPVQIVPSAFADKVVPLVGAGIAAFALLVLAFWGYRWRRRNARRW